MVSFTKMTISLGKFCHFFKISRSWVGLMSSLPLHLSTHTLMLAEMLRALKIIPGFQETIQWPRSNQDTLFCCYILETFSVEMEVSTKYYRLVFDCFICKTQDKCFEIPGITISSNLGGRWGLCFSNMHLISYFIIIRSSNSLIY